MTAERDGFVRVDCDFAADGLWSRRGSALSPEQLGLSPALCVALEAWQAHYDTLELQSLENPGFDFRDHERIGRKIADLVRAERPDLHVVHAGDEPYPGERGYLLRHPLFDGSHQCVPVSPFASSVSRITTIDGRKTERRTGTGPAFMSAKP